MNTAVDEYRLNERPLADSALLVQSRVVHALVMREVKSRFGGRRLGFLWALIEPVLMISVFIGMFYLIGRTEQGGVAAPLFFVAAFTPFFMFRDIYSNVMNSVKNPNALLMFPQVARTDIVVSSIIVDVIVTMAVLIVLLIGCVALGYGFLLDYPMQLFASMSLLIGLGVGLGLVLGALAIRYQFVSSFSQAFLGRPLFFTSGLFFTVDLLPAQARDYVLLNPVLHCIEGIRSALFTQYNSRFIDLSYVFVCVVVLIAFGLMLMNFFEKMRR